MATDRTAAPVSGHGGGFKDEPAGYWIAVPESSGARDDLDLPALLRRTWRGRLWIIAAAILGGILAGVHAFTTTPIYRSEAVLAVRSTDDGPLALLQNSQLGGLASLAGIGLGDRGGRRVEYLAFLESRELAREFIEAQGLMQILFKGRWDEATKTFKENWRGRVPTMGDAISDLEGIRTIREDRSGLITISFEWSDPELAAEWASGYVALANERLRREAIESAQQSLTHLNEQLERTSLEPLRQSLYRLMEGRLNEIMVAAVEHEFAFKVIDEARPPDPHRFVRPMRMLELLLGMAFGAAAGLVFVLWKYRKVDGGPTDPTG